MLAVLLSGSPYLLYDNVVSIDSPVLAAAISAPNSKFSGRLLGQTKWLDVFALVCWLCSGNNPRLSREMTRRTVLIRLAIDLAQPWTRTGFKHNDLIRWGLAHRAELLHAALTLVTAWVAAGQPKSREILGGFESWAEVIGGICEVAEVPGFLANRDELTIRDEETLRWSALIAAWWRQHQGAVVGIDDLFAPRQHERRTRSRLRAEPRPRRGQKPKAAVGPGDQGGRGSGVRVAPGRGVGRHREGLSALSIGLRGPAGPGARVGRRPG